MIRVSASAPWAEEPRSAPVRAPPWRPPVPDRLAFATLASSGAEPDRTTLVRVLALRRTRDGDWESFAGTCRTASGERRPLTPATCDAELGTALHCGPALRELHGFLGEHTVITNARAPFLGAWGRHGAAPPVRVLALAEIAALCLHGRLAAEGEALASRLCGRERAPDPLEPTHLRTAMGILAARVLAQAEPVRAVLFHSLRASARALERDRPETGREVEQILSLLEHPSTWRDPARALEPEAYELRDGRLSGAATELGTLLTALDAAQPRWRRGPEEGSGAPPLLRVEDQQTLGETDRRQVDEVFQAHLPRHFAASGEAGSSESYRAGQHAVASVIASSFGRRELRLVHAPTGTGKTLAYLVPVALWALRNHVRVGVATYTRALQEQAMEREAPIAMGLLRTALGASGVRFAVLKGRANYLCWRAFCLQAPTGDDPAPEVLAWSQLALFALGDADGDLDRFQVRAPLASLDPDLHRRAAERLLRAVRCETGCCSYSTDRATCAAEVAWRRAEHAHVILTNHALALARRDFFQHLVFDECEHLHEVAQNAFSTSVGVRQIAELLARLHGADGRRPLDRLLALAPDGSEAALHARDCLAAARESLEALAALGACCAAFKGWREEHAGERAEADRHSLFREYVLGHGAALVSAHGTLNLALSRLATRLALLQETLDSVAPERERPRLRRTLEILRLELEELRAGVAAWIPRDPHGAPAFGASAFHDLDTTPAGEDVLATRVLLPHEYLGRHYYPTLAGAVLLSATTWLRGGFETAAAYLGLARAAEPASDEEREPIPVEVFRAPEAFDYSRVLVCLPRDLPPVHDKRAFLDQSARFIAFLAERTRGRLLALYTNAEDVAVVGTRLEPFFAARRIPFWWQRMRGSTKEELSQLFRAHVDSVLLGLDTFWYGADFPGSTLEYLVIARLPYGVPDRYHHAQCAALGAREQRHTIYLPRALAKFRQGFGRLMRKESDRGCVFVLDKRILDPRHRVFLGELPVRGPWAAELGPAEGSECLARVVMSDAQRCLDEALEHMGLSSEVRRRGLGGSLSDWQIELASEEDGAPAG
jgi:Rad3-related DNA helicase